MIGSLRARGAVALLLCAVFGYGLGLYQSHRDLSRCRAQNEMLIKDLAKAVSKGVELETNLMLCKETKK